MKLINTTTFELSEFYEPKIPRYAILSHTWGEEEVSYQDWCSKAFPNKAGYQKIYQFCQICRDSSYEWAWVDTCCIDKSSSTELSEAINSMYRWYRGRTCYAYLADVPAIDVDENDSVFRLSRWFTRGWTLQELIAPIHVHFYSKDWVMITSRLRSAKTIEKITGILLKVLVKTAPLSNYSVAQKMSWASKRETTRIEDIAYCLLGIFGVNMPLLYGEGDKAFLRLQEEIMKITADHTLFAWSAPDSLTVQITDMDCGLLAPSPGFFKHSNQYIRAEYWASSSTKPFAMTNRGLEIELPLSEATDGQGSRLAIINCASLYFETKRVAIRIRHGRDVTFFGDTVMVPDGDYVRTHCNNLELVERSAISTRFHTLYIQRHGSLMVPYVFEGSENYISLSNTPSQTR